ncbi:protein disulfide isomerase-like 5-2 [Salvia splendens]|uniref:protein disulfide isomerase-like 5-2 n=1 Tax=Salvia splendens TaxID=180675 RepID=UPI001C271EF6|nr:protein disulfide isomerase-like 5-2 [Salvia splendens]
MASSPLTIYSSLQLLSLFSIALLSSEIGGASANQFKLDGKVLELTDSNFDAAISNFDYVFVDFYAPWCGHCKRLAPELDKAARVLAGLKPPVVVAKVDADKYRKLGSKHDVDGYPTLKVFIHGVPTEYFGPRKADLLVQHLTKFVAPDVTSLNSDSAIRDFIKEAGTNFPIFIGFGLNESSISEIAIKYKKKAWFSVAKDFSEDIMSFYDFDKEPALVAIHPAYNEKSISYGPFEEGFVEEYVKQSMIPLILPINQDSLKSLRDDDRKVVLTILENEVDDKSKEVIKVLKAAASANRDLVFGYVGLKQWGDFVESFEVYKKTPLPKMVVWDGDEEYYTVVGSESLDDTNLGNQVSKFLEGYREGSVIQKSINGPSLAGFIKSQIGVRLFLMILFVILVVVLILMMAKEEPLTVGTRDHATGERSSASQPETRESRRDAVKED